MADTAEGVGGYPMTLRVFDPTEIPDEPDPSLLHHHRYKIGKSVRDLWNRREIIYTLAERDIRATYKEATLGILWAVITPLVTLVVMVFVFKRIKSFNTGDVPYALFAYCGILAWGYFSSAFSSGANSLLSNKGLLSKIHFPRECFPLAQLLESGVSSALATAVLVVLCLWFHFVPHVQAAWIPLFLVIEVIFTAGVALAASALIVHVRDLAQVTGVIISLGLFATPVIWPFSKLPVRFQAVYSFFNPIGPVIDNIRRTFLYGQSPAWGLLAIALAGALVYLSIGFWTFRRLEADLADIA
ncbi:MAG TPA: ABC transporter permease [Acidimicrobiales bacterium]|nr:ABC transporter permease [Acidimicrobiales bacterium]